MRPRVSRGGLLMGANAAFFLLASWPDSRQPGHDRPRIWFQDRPRGSLGRCYLSCLSYTRIHRDTSHQAGQVKHPQHQRPSPAAPSIPLRSTGSGSVTSAIRHPSTGTKTPATLLHIHADWLMCKYRGPEHHLNRTPSRLSTRHEGPTGGSRMRSTSTSRPSGPKATMSTAQQERWVNGTLTARKVNYGSAAARPGWA
jgi:hypothetical protein